MDYKEYPKEALNAYSDTIQATVDAKDRYFMKSMKNAIFCPLIEDVGERNSILTGGPASVFYKEATKFCFEQDGKFLEHLASVFPEDANIEYLRNAFKVISYKTTINTGKSRKKTEVHPAFFPFIDSVEALRRASFLTLSTVWADNRNLFFNSDWGVKFKNKNVLSIKLIERMYYDPQQLKEDETFRNEYGPFRERYFEGVDFAINTALQTWSKLEGVEEPTEQVKKVIEYPGQQLKDNYPPDADALADGLSFFAVQVKEKLEELFMYCDRGRTVFAPSFYRLQPTFNYNAERQEAYLQELEKLKPQRDKNAVLILQEAENPDEYAKIIFSGIFFSYNSLKAILPPERAEEELEAITTTFRTTAKRVKKVNFPLDKVNNNVWDDMEHSYDGQLSFSTLKAGKEKEVTVLASINFDNVEGAKISKKLTHFDKRVYVAEASLVNAGNEFFSLTQIHTAMGNVSRPANYQLKKINDSLTKMMTATLFVNNINEIEKAKYKYAKFNYDGPLLPAERVTAVINGKVSNSVIHAFREPPLITFARERNQITTFDVKVLQAPISKTDNNIAIEDYLIERIAEAKNASKKNNKVVINTILLETMYNKIGIENRTQKSRTLKSLKIFLDHFVDCDFISKYIIDKDRIVFFWNKRRVLQNTNL